ncbi:2-amino-4-hydroxy-6-hydroxymethyldihydropteridine diphosphokinase [Barnesiella viscericola]|uniref:2-amino-4-hydroxy-6- hydroxymethyldihydropteridine diphosphokinase n=1 Tax=Barnesiella viscericola TaxID=397865 RepID=UPI002356CC33|nr:2-amino-4-hydroxy-6-hydroxymethyldihydropteridine diphosphokinase [Barnesiella viscericola]
MNSALISLASNSPDKQGQMEKAFAELQAMGIVAEASSIYETAPCGNPRHPNYLNAVVRIDTSAEYQTLHDTLKAMERAHGRTPQSKLSGEIPLDLDIVVWNGETLRPQDYGREYFQIGLNEIESAVKNQHPHPIVTH